MGYGAPDLGTLFSQFGVPVVAGTVTGVGILDIEDATLLTGDGQSIAGRTIKLTYAAASFRDALGVDVIKQGAALTVDGVAYTVTTARAHEDGDLAIAFLRKK